MLTPARVTLVMLVAVGGLVTAYVAKNLLATEAPPPVPSRTVPMALADLEPGTVITEAHVGPGFTSGPLSPDVLISDRVIVGRIVKQRIPAATPIRSGDLYPPGDRPSLPVAEGMRAVSVTVDGQQAMVDGLVKPGQHVDVHLSPAVSGDDPRFGGGMTFTLLRGIKILAINRSQQPGGADRGGNTVTLELTPEQSNVLLLARSNGVLNLTYNPTPGGSPGTPSADAQRATLNEILDLPPVQSFSTEHYRGTGRTTQEFRNGRTTAINPAPSNDRPEPTAANAPPRT